ncbi:general substrate transporter [Microdochium trichocladiopsis]|uniref:General substrate transporter n=1 Tax=Microdochium trichocladiopsis TaxID=1682393 RepID=A0A9P8XRT6_9PEZI|nr:general substrate transporter [Microdochium trichocladiopsis]KAH7014227.1 general substrate transporter [Microdochium trichocladiopsis]
MTEKSRNNAGQEKPDKGFYFLGGRQYPRVQWTKDPNMRKLYIYCFLLILVNVANGFDGSMMNGLQSLPLWQDYFDHPVGVRLSLFGSAMTLGGLLALPVIPWCCDHLGRKKTVIIGSFIILLGVALQAGAINFPMFFAARIILGTGMTLATTAGPLLVAEIAHPQDRAILTTFMGLAYAIGSFVASWVTFGTLKIPNDWAWRVPSLLQCWCTVIILCIIWWIPESPRFYIARDEHEKALAILAHYHGAGDENNEIVQLEYNEIRTAIAMDRENNINSSWMDFVSTPGNRKRLMLVVALAAFAQWSGNGIVSYYLKLVLDGIGITNSQDQLGINSGSKTMSLLVNLGVAFFIDRFGRRPILLVSTTGMFVMFLIWTILSALYNKDAPNPALGRAVVGLIYAYNFCYNFKTGLPLTYTTEILPYGLRAKGAAVSVVTTTATVFFNQFINPIAMNNIQWRYYIFYVCFLAFEIVFLYFMVVETRYVPMEEIAKHFDGEQADVAAVAAGKTAELEHGAAVSHVEISHGRKADV